MNITKFRGYLILNLNDSSEDLLTAICPDDNSFNFQVITIVYNKNMVWYFLVSSYNLYLIVRWVQSTDLKEVRKLIQKTGRLIAGWPDRLCSWFFHQ